jgi:hypothetical protein
MQTINKVLANVAQGLSSLEQAQARANIGAAAASDISTAITAAINDLDVEDHTVANQFVTNVSEYNGKVSVQRRQATVNDIDGLSLALSSLKQVWTFEEMSAPVEWTGVGSGTWKSFKSIYVPAGGYMAVTVQGIASWDASTGEGLAVLQMGPNDSYMSSGYYGRTALCATWPNSATGNAYSTFSQTLHYYNGTSSAQTVYIGAYNGYGIGNNTLRLTSSFPADTAGPNIQWTVY